jgi:hypothetical protein
MLNVALVVGPALTLSAGEFEGRVRPARNSRAAITRATGLRVSRVAVIAALLFARSVIVSGVVTALPVFWSRWQHRFRCLALFAKFLPGRWELPAFYLSL